MTELKISFKNDYSEGAHPQILQALLDHNLSQTAGYGYDPYSTEARQLIAKALGVDPEIFLVAGGTQANMLVISHLLRPYESVIATDISHIHEHETGAIEATGHMIHLLPHREGKLVPDQIRRLVSLHLDEHQVIPRLIFISLATEVGTVYTQKELKAIAQTARELGLLVYIDGARLATALVSEASDWELDLLPQVADVFYIGGTKNGALLGEAIVFRDKDLARNFKYHRKQKGALIAKGRLLGLQFSTLFSDGLYEEIAKHALEISLDLADFLSSQGVEFRYPVETNQIFPILSTATIEHLEELFEFHRWEQLDEDKWVARLVCSWATIPAQIAAFRDHFKIL